MEIAHGQRRLRAFPHGYKERLRNPRRCRKRGDPSSDQLL